MMTAYDQENKEKLPKKASERYQNLSEEEKKWRYARGDIEILPKKKKRKEAQDD